MVGKFLAGPVGSWLRVAVTVILSMWLADLTSGESWTFDWSAYALGAVVALLPVIIAFLNPVDTRFGRGSG